MVRRTNSATLPAFTGASGFEFVISKCSLLSLAQRFDTFFQAYKLVIWQRRIEDLETAVPPTMLGSESVTPCLEL
jgi:hypothetical protein